MVLLIIPMASPNNSPSKSVAKTTPTPSVKKDIFFSTEERPGTLIIVE